jgi:predicted HD phosphohydrolase
VLQVQTVSFNAMADGTREDYELLDRYAEEYERTLADRVLGALGALAPYNHGELAAVVLRPFVSEECWWILKHHGVFQLYYYAHHSGGDRNLRDRYRESPYFEACVEFCELYDQSSFDPGYESLPVGFFEPMVRRVLAEPRFLGGDIS